MSKKIDDNSKNNYAIIPVELESLKIQNVASPSGYEVYINGGRKPTGLDAIEWAKYVVAHGAGEILLTSIDKDGTNSGYDIELLKKTTKVVNVPVL